MVGYAGDPTSDEQGEARVSENNQRRASQNTVSNANDVEPCAPPTAMNGQMQQGDVLSQNMHQQHVAQQQVSQQMPAQHQQVSDQQLQGGQHFNVTGPMQQADVRSQSMHQQQVAGQHVAQQQVTQQIPAQHQQVLDQQLQAGQHSNQHAPTQPQQVLMQQHNVQHVVQQENLQQLLQVPSQGSQSFHRQPSESYSPQISPLPSAPKFAQPPQNQALAQVLPPIPPHPLFQQQHCQPNGIVGSEQQLGKQHVAMQHLMVHPQQLQQPYQQQLQQLQTPILYTAPASNSPSKAPKVRGRFRVVKSVTTDAKAPSGVATDNQSVTSSVDTQVIGAGKATPVTAVKKGRFLVKKGAVAASHISASAEVAAKAGKKKTGPQSSDATKSMKKGMNDNVAPNEQTTGVGDNASGVSTATTTLGDTKNPCTKKKGRFLVKTAGNSANLQTTENAPLRSATSGAESTIASAGDSTQAAEKVPKKKPNGHLNGSEETTAAKGKSGVVSLDKSVDSGRRASSDAEGISQGVSTKKRGRFVVKTGGSAASTPAASTSAASMAWAGSEAVQNTGPINTQFAQLTPPIQIPTYVSDGTPLSLAGASIPMTPLIDANGQMVLVSNMALPALQPTVQQQHLQQIAVPQLQVPSQCGTPSVQSVVSDVGLQPQSQQYPVPAAPRPRVMTEERPENVAPVPRPNVPRPNRPAGSSGSNWSSGIRALPGGKNGRLIGTGGVGKVLHHLDTLRSEIVEADRSIHSLQSDNRFLKDKNKELEAKVKDLERQLSEEKRLRRSVETKLQKVREETDAKQAESEAKQRIEITPSSEGCASKKEENRVPSDPSLSNQPGIGTTTSEQQKLDGGGASWDTACSTIASKSSVPRIVKMKHGPDPKAPRSRNNSFDASDMTQTHVHTGLNPAFSQSTSGRSSIVKQFDPLGTAPHSHTHRATASQTCLSTVASIDPQKVAIPLIVTTAPTPPIVNTNGSVACQGTPNVSNKTKHFDPLGTPERNHDATTTVPAYIINGAVPHMPSMAAPINGNVAMPVVLPLVHHQSQQPQQNQQEDLDLFDELARISQNHGPV